MIWSRWRGGSTAVPWTDSSSGCWHLRTLCELIGWAKAHHTNANGAMIFSRLCPPTLQRLSCAHAQPMPAASLRSLIRSCWRFPYALNAAPADAQRDRREAVDAEDVCRRRAEIDYPSAHERPAIVDTYDCGAAVAVVDDGDHAAERQRAVGCCHRGGVHAFAARGAGVAIDRRDTRRPVSLLATSGRRG